MPLKARGAWPSNVGGRQVGLANERARCDRHLRRVGRDCLVSFDAGALLGRRHRLE